MFTVGCLLIFINCWLLQRASGIFCSQDFLNGVCTNIIHMHKKQLNYYTGNYDQYVQTRAELEENQMKRFKWEQEQISHMKVTQHITLWGQLLVGLASLRGVGGP